MQMFVLDADPVKSAQALCDAHVRVICREVTMLLSTWYWYNVPSSRPDLPYSPMNENQPLALQLKYVPVRRWAVQNARAIFDEFTFRFEKTHASEVKYLQLLAAIEKHDKGIEIGLRQVRFTFVPKGEGVYSGKTMSQAILLYRKYFKGKLDVMKVPVVFTKRCQPSWLEYF